MTYYIVKDQVIQINVWYTYLCYGFIFRVWKWHSF